MHVDIASLSPLISRKGSSGNTNAVKTHPSKDARDILIQD